MSALGLDIGTTFCKAVAFDNHGRQLCLARREYSLQADGGKVELDSRAVCEAALAVVAEAARGCPSDPVRAVGVSCQGEAFTPVGGDGAVLGNAMVSSDTRAADQVARLSKSLGAESLYAITGHTAHPMFTLFKLAWLRENDPEVWKRASRFLCFEDLFAQTVGLEPTLGYSLAGRTMLFDVRRHEWSPEILTALDVTPNRLGAPVPSGTIIGTIPKEIARRLGLGKGPILVAGGHDQACGALGAGATEPGVAMFASGTVECICASFSNPLFTPALFGGNFCTYDAAVPGSYATLAFSLTGGNLLQWFRDVWSNGAGDYDTILASMSMSPSRLLVLPYFTASGTPYFDTVTPGAILGLRLSATRGDLLRALLEGVAMEMRLNLEILGKAGVRTEELRAIGGGARNPGLLQLKADVLNRRIVRVAVTEAGCLGAAMLAHASLEGADVREVARSWVRPVSSVTPEPATSEHYAAQFARYREAYTALSGLARRDTT